MIFCLCIGWLSLNYSAIKNKWQKKTNPICNACITIMDGVLAFVWNYSRWQLFSFYWMHNSENNPNNLAMPNALCCCECRTNFCSVLKLWRQTHSSMQYRVNAKLQQGSRGGKYFLSNWAHKTTQYFRRCGNKVMLHIKINSCLLFFN